MCAVSTLTTGLPALPGTSLSTRLQLLPHTSPEAGGPVQVWPSESLLLLVLMAASLPPGSPGSRDKAETIPSHASTLDEPCRR